MGYETAKIITEEGLEGLGRYYSIYRGQLLIIMIPKEDEQGKVCIPEVMGGTFAWALPKGQHGSISSGFKFLAPKVGDIVFITLNLVILLNPYGNIMVGV